MSLQPGCWGAPHFPCACAEMAKWQTLCNEDGSLAVWVQQQMQNAGPSPNFVGSKKDKDSAVLL